MTPNIETIISTVKTIPIVRGFFKHYELAEMYNWSIAAYQKFPEPIKKVVSQEEFGYFVVMNYVHNKYGKEEK